MYDNANEPLDELRTFLEKQAKEKAARPPAPKSVPDGPFSKLYPRLFLALQLAVVSGAAIYIYLSLPSLRTSLHPDKQVRFGVYDTDRGTEKCITGLWKAAGAAGAVQTACPVSGLPYKVEGQKISCPSPEKHRLTALYFSPEKGVVARRDK